MLKVPAFTITAVAALALGIVANTAIFSVGDAVPLKPIPVPDPDRFAMLINTFVSQAGQSGSSSAASPAKFEHWRTQSGVLEDVSAFRAGVMNYTGGDFARAGAFDADVAGWISPWTRRFAGEPYTVIGIVAANPGALEFGLSHPNTTDQGHYFQAVARLKPGVALREAPSIRIRIPR